MTTLRFINALSMQALVAKTAADMGADLVNALDPVHATGSEPDTELMDRALRRLHGLRESIDTFPIPPQTGDLMLPRTLVKRIVAALEWNPDVHVLESNAWHAYRALEPLVCDRWEKISGSALMMKDRVVVWLEKPARHNDVIHHMVGTLGHSREAVAESKQGFITNRARWLSREAALIVAKRAGQLIRKTGPDDQLFSEDLW